MPPGTAYVGSWDIPDELGYSPGGVDLELVPGFQSVRVELVNPFTFRIEFRVDGAALPYDDEIYWGLHEGIRAVGHAGQSSYVLHKVARVTAPGAYEISFEGVGADRFLPIPPQRVEVLEEGTPDVIVELRRK